MGKKLGSILGSISPGYGLISGQGAGGDILGSLSPLVGLLSGDGLFGNLGDGKDKGSNKGHPVQDTYDNPGDKMFGMASGSQGSDSDMSDRPSFFQRFGNNLQEQLFQRAMQGMGGGMGGY